MPQTFLLTWNPDRWPWTSLDQDVEALRAGRRRRMSWSTGATNSIQKGDRLFLLRQGKEPRGIIASGYAVGECYEGEHWDEPRAGQGKLANYVPLKFDVLLHPIHEGPLGGKALTIGALSKINWRPQASGTRIPDDAVAALEEAWALHVQAMLRGSHGSMAAAPARRTRAEHWPPPSTDGMTLYWPDGWIEPFPEMEFVEECDQRPGRLLLYKHGQSPRPEDYLLSVSGHVAELEFGGQFLTLNGGTGRGWDTGRLRITFKDEMRTAVERLEWAAEGSHRYILLDVRCSWAQEERSSSTPFSIPSDGDQRLRATADAVLRPGQWRFRESLREAYGGQCAITEFGVWAALEAAHIVPYRGAAYDHIQNGLLLRADLHRLFDRLLLTIDPKARTVVLAPELSEIKEYVALQGRPLRLPRYRLHRPATAALAHHWTRFCKHHK